jgi:hypothetical protein
LNVAKFEPLYQIAPKSNSSPWAVVSVFPEFGRAVFPVAVAFWSRAAAVRPENSLALAAAPTELEGKVTVMVSATARERTLCAEQRTTRPPLVLVLSASTP